MSGYSVSRVARVVKVSRRTLERWVKDGLIPAPVAAIVDGKLVKSWTDSQIAMIKEFKSKTYRGKGIDRRKGSRADQIKSRKK